jgi:hypothetical protein
MLPSEEIDNYNIPESRPKKEFASEVGVDSTSTCSTCASTTVICSTQYPSKRCITYCTRLLHLVYLAKITSVLFLLRTKKNVQPELFEESHKKSEIYCHLFCYCIYQIINLYTINDNNIKMNATINQNNVDSDASFESDVYEDNQTPYTGNGEESLSGNDTDEGTDIDVNEPIGDVDLEIVGLFSSTNGRSCSIHSECGSVVKVGDLLRLKPTMVMVEGLAENAVKLSKITDNGVEGCIVAYIPRNIINVPTVQQNLGSVSVDESSVFIVSLSLEFFDTIELEAAAATAASLLIHVMKNSKYVRSSSPSVSVLESLACEGDSLTSLPLSLISLSWSLSEGFRTMSLKSFLSLLSSCCSVVISIPTGSVKPI